MTSSKRFSIYLSIAGILMLTGGSISRGASTLSVPPQPVHAVEVAPAKTITASSNTPVISNDEGSGPDDDDDGELLYHWQNKLYVMDERRQIGEISLFLIVVGGLAAMRTRGLRSHSRAARGPLGGRR